MSLASHGEVRGRLFVPRSYASSRMSVSLRLYLLPHTLQSVEFIWLWKDVDPDIPILIEAKKEYEKLK
jgi:hypothetical protein